MDTPKISLRTFIIWSAVIISAVAGGTYTFTTAILDDRVNALQESVKIKEEKINQLQQQRRSDVDIFIPESIKEIADPKLIEDIKEAERNQKEITRRIIAIEPKTFDPSSEINELAKLLKSEDKDKRKNAILGFHEIRSKNASLFLSEYFFSHQDEATVGGMPSITQWIWLFEDFGIDEGTLFCINLIKEGDDFNSRTGYEELKERVESGRDISLYVDELKKMAIGSPEPLKRTWAKIILKIFDEVKENPKATKDNRSLFRVLLDIEKYVRENIPTQPSTSPDG